MLPLVSLLWLCAPFATPAEPAGRPYRFGFTRSVFKHWNENDMKAAIKVWTQTLARERGLKAVDDVLILDSVRGTADALRNGDVDAVVLMLDEFAVLPPGLVSGPYIRDEINGRTLSEFVLLARRGSGVETIEDLRGARLTVVDDRNTSMSTRWLGAELAAAGLGRLEQAFSSIEVSPKLSAAVLGVFFGRSDACLVTREGFETMAALNPQVSARLGVVAASPPVAPSLSCFRADMDEQDKQTLAREIMRLQETVTGEQVLRVFKADRMSEVTPEKIDRSLVLFRAWDAAVSGRPLLPPGEPRPD